MKKYIIKKSALILSLIFLVSYAAPTSAKSGQIYAMSAPNVAKHINKTTGMKRAVFVYASWCPHCRKKAPEILEIERLKPGSIIALSVDDDPGALRKFLSTLPRTPSTIILMEETSYGELERIMGAPKERTGVPSFIFLDENNKVYTSGNFKSQTVAEYVLSP